MFRVFVLAADTSRLTSFAAHRRLVEIGLGNLPRAGPVEGEDGDADETEHRLRQERAGTSLICHAE